MNGGWRRRVEVLAVALRLGLTSFGGPVAHLGYFRDEYVRRREWLDDRTYADLVTVGQFLPGPASSEVGMGVGYLRAGLPGTIVAWIGFTLPSAVLMAGFAAGIGGVDPDAGWLSGLAIAAVAVVALAVWQMGSTLAPDGVRASIAVGAAALVLLWPSVAAQVIAIAAGALAGRLLVRPQPFVEPAADPFPTRRRLAVASLATFLTLLLALPILSATTSDETVDVVDAFYRTGSLVFGGGHVVLPLLEGEMVETGWVSADEFVAGYGAVQAVPGPLFTFATYLGYVMEPEPNGVAGAAIATVAVFLPGLLLVVGVLPFWGALRRRAGAARALAGVNAAVVGLLAAALYDPVWTSAIDDGKDVALALAAFVLLVVWKLPAWAVVPLAAFAGAALAL